MPTVMTNYYKNPAATKDAFITINNKKYFKTGDLGHMVDGRVSVLGSNLFNNKL